MRYRFFFCTLAVVGLTFSCSQPDVSTPTSPTATSKASETAPDSPETQQPKTSTKATDAATTDASAKTQLGNPVGLEERDCDGDGLLDKPYDLNGDDIEDGCDINHGALDEDPEENVSEAGVDKYHGEIDLENGVDKYHGEIDLENGVDKYHGEIDLDDTGTKDGQ